MKLLQRAAGLILSGSLSLVFAAQNITVYPDSDRITYSGSMWDSFSYPCSGATVFTIQTERHINFNFVGTAIYVLGTTSSSGGIVTFTLDNDVATDYDRYSSLPSIQCSQMMFAKGGLTNDSHSFNIQFTGIPSPENSTGTNARFEWQYIMYTQLDPTDVTYSASPTPISVPTSDTASIPTAATTSGEPTQTTSSEHRAKVNAAAIGGGVAAGAVGLAIAGFAIWYCVRRNNLRDQDDKTDRPDLDPVPESFIYSPVEVSEDRRPSHDGAAARPSLGKNRSSMSTLPDTTPTPWVPDAQLATNLAPHALHSSGPASLPDSDVERIAARFASMLLPNLQQQQHSSGGVDAQPPPMYEPPRYT